MGSGAGQGGTWCRHWGAKAGARARPAAAVFELKWQRVAVRQPPEHEQESEQGLHWKLSCSSFLRQGRDHERTRSPAAASGNGTAWCCTTARGSAPPSTFLTVSGRDWRAWLRVWVGERGDPVACPIGAGADVGATHGLAPKPQRSAVLPVFTSPTPQMASTCRPCC